MSLSSRWQHLCTISIMLGGASKYAAGRLVSRLGLGTTTSSFRPEAVPSKQQLRIFQPAAAALFKQLQILAAATNQLAKKIQLPTRKISSVCSWARASSIMAYSGPVIDVRVSPTTIFPPTDVVLRKNSSWEHFTNEQESKIYLYKLKCVNFTL